MFAQDPHYKGGGWAGGQTRPSHRCAGTHIVQDGERFRQRFAEQADPFGKQLVQMFAEMLTDSNTG